METTQGNASRRRARMATLGCTALVAMAAAAPAALAATSDAQVTVTGGSLSLTAVDFQAVSTALTGSAETIQTTPASAWTAIDARGTGAAWTVVASATDLVSSGAPDRVIPSSAIAFTTGTVTAGSGADATTGMTGATGQVFTVPTGAGQTNVSVISAPGPHRGTYTFTPQLDITVPANALASYVGAPYTTTLTVTIS